MTSVLNKKVDEASQAAVNFVNSKMISVYQYVDRDNGRIQQEIEANKAQYRQGLIDLGNWGRKQSPDYWLEKIIAQEGNIVVTDVRIKHEYEVFKKAGATAIRVEATRETRLSRGNLIGETDITEVGLDNITDWDFIIDNNGNYESLEEKAFDLIEKLKIRNYLQVRKRNFS